MANIDHAPSRTMLNLLHVLPAFAEEAALRLHAIVELNSNTINKYELITETGQLKLDRVGYSSLAYPFAYGCIPRTWDEDGDPLDIEIVGVCEPLVPGSVVEARIIGIMTSYTQLGDHWQKETEYDWEHYKDLKKPGTCRVNGFFDAAEAVRIVKECEARYLSLIDPKLVN